MKKTYIIPSTPLPFNKSFIALLTILTSITFCKAQELKENVAIQGHYAPKVVKTDKIYTTPQRITFTLESPTLECDYTSTDTHFANDILTMPVTTWQADRTIQNRKGYLRLNLGSWLNANLSAGYKFIDNNNTTFGISLQHNSSSLQKPYPQNDIKRFHYDETLCLYASNKFKDAGTLNAAFNYHLGFFNYFMLPTSTTANNHTETQTLNDIKAALGWNNTSLDDKKIYYSTDLKLRAFNYRALYLPSYLLTSQTSTTPLPSSTTHNYAIFHPDRENHIALTGQITAGEKENKLNIDAAFNLLTYSNCKICVSQLATQYKPTYKNTATDKITTPPANYGLISLRPAWKLLKNNLNITLGAQVDMAINAPGNTIESHYSLFHIAPDVKIAWGNKQFGVSLQAIGGSKLNTMASAYDEVYYSTPLAISNQPSHTPLDAILDLNFGPFAGFQASLTGEYKIQHHIPTTALYPAILAYQSPYSSTCAQPAMANIAAYGLPSQQYDLRGSQLSLRLQYSPLRQITASATAKWTPQNKTTGYYNGFDRPTVVTQAAIDIHPIQPLSLNIEYMLRHNRAIYTLIPASPQYVDTITLEDISLLNFSAAYQLNSHLTISLQAYNILNRRTETLPALPATGIEFSGGLQWLF